MQTDKEKEISSDTIDLSRTVNDIDYKNNVHIDKDVKNISGNNDIDEQVTNSMQKLMEEEISVARAFISQDDRLQGNIKQNTEDTSAVMKTQAIPDLSKELEGSKSGDAEIEDDTENKTTEDGGKKKLTKNQKIKLGVSIGIAAVLVIIAIIAAVLVNSSNKKKSYEFNYDKAMEFYDSKDYSSAIPYMEKAASTSEGSKNTELLFDLYLCYRNTEQNDKAIETLKNILDVDKYNKKAIQAMASFYVQTKDSAALNSLIQSFMGTEAQQYIEDYIVKSPIPSKEAGTYNDNIKLQFVVDSGCSVYYTLDGSTPTDKSDLYSSIIEIKSGVTTVKAIAMNSMGIYSEVVELKYEVDYKKPDAPSINPVSGNYQSGQLISVDNIPDGGKVYYTIDGSTPTKDSILYTESFKMPEGNTIVSAIIIDQNEQVSDVTRRNYVVSNAGTKQLTYNEAEAELITRLQNKGVIQSDGSTTPTGGIVAFYLQSKITVQNIEIYYIKMDVKTNGAASTYGYYGVDVKTGACYTVTQSGNSYSMSQL